MAKPFASSADLEAKRSALEELAPGIVAFTAEGDPNVGAVIGDDAVLAVDARATPALAREWLDELIHGVAAIGTPTNLTTDATGFVVSQRVPSLRNDF